MRLRPSRKSFAVVALALAAALVAVPRARDARAIEGAVGPAAIARACSAPRGCPSRILFDRPGSFDTLSFRGIVELPEGFAADRSPFAVVLRNAQGEVLAEMLDAGKLRRSDRRWLYTDAGARRLGGISRLELRRVGVGRFVVNLLAYEDLSEAILPEMTIVLVFEPHVFELKAMWSERAFGWLLHTGDQPDATPTPSSSATPGPTASPAPTASPSPTPSPTPTATPSPTPTATPSPTPTATPSPTPTATPSPTPTATPSPTPTATPSPTPSASPSPSPSPVPTASPSPTPVVACATTMLTVTIGYQDPGDPVTGVSVFLGYPGNRINIINEALLEQVTNASGVSGTFLVADNDTNANGVDDQIAIGLLTSGQGVPPGNFARVLYDCVDGQSRPVAQDFTCTVEFATLFGNVPGTCQVTQVEYPPYMCNGQVATIVGTDAGEPISGTANADVIVARGGNDTITALGQGDVVCGGPGNDSIDGGAGNDTLFGNSGDDTINGAGGTDVCNGGPGNDTFSGCETIVQ